MDSLSKIKIALILGILALPVAAISQGEANKTRKQKTEEQCSLSGANTSLMKRNRGVSVATYLDAEV